LRKKGKSFENLSSKSTIRSLAKNSDLSFTDLVRGKSSLGQIFEEYGFPAVPSKNQPHPEKTDLYFNGGFNVRTYSKLRLVDAIQLELNKDLRTNN